MDLPPTFSAASDPNALSTLPSLCGVDMATALKRLAGDASIYAWVLLTFREEQQKSLPLLDSLFQDDMQRKHAARSIHTLKGQAATIGAQELSDHAQELESMLLSGHPLPECMARWQDIKRRLRLLLDAIGAAQQALNSRMAAGSAPPPGNR